MKTTMAAAIRDWMNTGHLYASEALAIEPASSGTAAWVIVRETRAAIKLYASRALAERAISCAAAAYDRNKVSQ